ncbi:hypothetical protein K439DRAFT_1616596 [Ramaria rubella]|nr:hypothetical protein K439DRAFT_1616596 [Ramaria rubella]
MPWSDLVANAFATLAPGPGFIEPITDTSPAADEEFNPLAFDSEVSWYVPWTVLLNELFPQHKGYVVVSNYGGITEKIGHQHAIDLTDAFVVQAAQYPIFFLELKPPSHLKNDSTCQLADMQMRQRFTLMKSMYSSFHQRGIKNLPTIYGISAMATRISVFQYDVASETLLPKRLYHINPHLVGDTAPLSRWLVDVLTDEGEGIMRKIGQETTRHDRSLYPKGQFKHSTGGQFKHHRGRSKHCRGRASDR